MYFCIFFFLNNRCILYVGYYSIVCRGVWIEININMVVNINFENKDIDEFLEKIVIFL